MTEYLRVHTERGRLSYLPDERQQSNRHSVCTSTPSDYLQTRGPIFNPRSRRPQRIHIARVPPDFSLTRRKSRRSRPVVIEKLAGPRENAKRFLRSFIASHGDKDKTSPSPTRAPSVGGGENEQSSAEGQRAVSCETLRTMPHPPIGGPVSGMISRPVLAETVRSASGRSTSSRKSVVSSITQTIPDDKPLASGNGISVGIALAEPVLFLQGFEQSEHSERSTAMLRGSLHLRITKSAKIKAVTLKFKGKATTKWPEGTSFPCRN